MTTPAEDKQNTVLYVRVPIDVRTAVRDLSKKTGLSQAMVVEMLLRRALAGGHHQIETAEQRLQRAIAAGS